MDTLLGVVSANVIRVRVLAKQKQSGKRKKRSNDQEPYSAISLGNADIVGHIGGLGLGKRLVCLFRHLLFGLEKVRVSKVVSTFVRVLLRGAGNLGSAAVFPMLIRENASITQPGSEFLTFNKAVESSNLSGRTTNLSKQSKHNRALQFLKSPRR